MATPSPKETLFHHARDYFDRMQSLIAHSQQSILLETYIFAADALGERIAKALCEAAYRGVKIKVIVDGVGAEPGFVHLARRMQQAGIEIRVHRPLPWDFSLWPYALVRYRGWRKAWYFLSYINRRDHRKMLVVDGHTIMLGSINLTLGHLNKTQGGKDWRDTAIEASHVPLKAAEKAFELTWNAARRPEQKRQAHHVRHSPFLLNYTRRLRRLQRKLLLWKIQQAKQRIWITNAYFVPDRYLLSQLTQASRRGVDIRILLPRRSDIFFVPWMSATFYTRLIAAGCTIFEYQPSILHAKTLLIDDWGIIGSTNLNRRSLHHDLEIDYVLQNKQSVTELAHFFEQDCRHAGQITQENMQLEKRWQGWLGSLLLLFFGYFV